jgi:hypothetical protein
MDEGPITVDSAIPGAAFGAQRSQSWDASLTQALPGEQTDFDFRLVEPTGVFGCVMHGEAAPQISPGRLAKVIDQDFAGVGAQVIDH